MHISWCNQDYTGSRTRGTRQAELLHSLTVKLTETFPALRQAAEGKKETLGWLPDAAYRWRATCWYSRSIHTSHILCEKSLQLRYDEGWGVMADAALVQQPSEMTLKCVDSCKDQSFGFCKVLPITSLAHLAPDSFSSDARSRERLATTRSLPIPALLTHLENG